MGGERAQNSFRCHHLRFLTRFGTCIAFQNGVNSEMNTNAQSASSMAGQVESVLLDSERVRAIRHGLHELANALTGVSIAGGLLCQYLEGGSLGHYAVDICDSNERASALAREIRTLIVEACGVETSPGSSSGDPIRGQ
jgi:hypothetical protein